jgi:drug/metabolite transporter (DMT)-like permease
MMRFARGMWRQTWRAGVAVAGGIIVLVGIALLVLPGPGLLTIGAGLALLALEFEAARDLRDQLAGWVRARVLREEAKARARERAARGGGDTVDLNGRA